MKFGEIRIKSDYVYVMPLADIHIGDKAFGEKEDDLLRRNIEWVKSEPNARVFLNGDILNCATRSSASSPMFQNKNLHEQIEYAIELFEPIKDKIVGCIDGNHEERLGDFTGFSPTTAIAYRLGIPYYKYSAVINFLVGKGHGISYTFYFHHTTGGGSTVGAKMNRVDKLRKLVCNCDCYVGSHNHQLGIMPVSTRQVDVIHKRIITVRQLLVDAGSYLGWDENYSEAMQMEPVKLGSPRIRLEGGRKDIHASL